MEVPSPPGSFGTPTACFEDDVSSDGVRRSERNAKRSVEAHIYRADCSGTWSWHAWRREISSDQQVWAVVEGFLGVGPPNVPFQSLRQGDATRSGSARPASLPADRQPGCGRPMLRLDN
jgi:hypothetical protein